MAESTHSIRMQTFEIDVASEEAALVLQPRFGDLNRQRLNPVIERVFGEFDLPGRRMRIDRLVVDLGELPLAGFDAAAEAALYDALRRSLHAAIAGEGADGGVTAIEPADEGPLALLAYHLQQGTLPFWSASAGVVRDGFSLPGLVRSLARSEPRALASLVRRIGGTANVLERLALQLDEAALQTLLRLLEPEHAALILAYMIDLRLIQRAEPQLQVAESEFEKLLWLLVLRYLVHDAGTQFNRKSFVAAILQGMARREGLDYRDLVALLAQGLRNTLRHLPIASSLPAVINELSSELGRVGAASAPVVAPADGVGPTTAVGLGEPDLAHAEPAILAALVRRRGGDRRLLALLVAQLDDAALQAVLHLLEPVHAGLIIAYLLDLRQVHGAAPLVPLGEPEFGRLLWVLALSYLVHDAGSQFNRRSFVRVLLQRLAEAEGLDYDALLVTLARGLRTTARHRPLASSLPAVIDEIVRDTEPASAAGPANAARSGAAFAAADPAALAALVRQYGHDRGMLERLVAGLDDKMLEAVLGLLEPAHAALVLAYLFDLQRLHREAPLLPRGEAAYRRLIWVLALSYLAREAGSQFNRKSFMRALLEGLASSEGLAYAKLLAVLESELRVMAVRQPITSSLPAVIDELARETGPGLSAQLADPAATVEPYLRRDALRYYLRYGVLPLDLLLGRRDLTAEMLTTALPALELGQWRDLFAGLVAEERLAALLRAVRALPADVLNGVVQRLLPHWSDPESPLVTALAAAAAAARHRDIFYAHLIAALLDDADIDVEALTAAAARPTAMRELAVEPDTWPAPRLAAALVDALRSEAEAAAGAGWDVMLEALLTRHPAEAKSFLHAIAASADWDMVAARLAPRHFGRIIASMLPAEAPAVRFLLAAIEGLPIAERAGSPAEIRRSILSAVMGIRAGAAATRANLERIVQAVFGKAPSAALVASLRSALERAALPEALRADLAAALNAAQAPPVPDEPPLAGLRDALFQWLRGLDSGPAAALPVDLLAAALPDIIGAYPEAVRAFLQQHVSRSELRTIWAARLPEAALARLVAVLEPRHVRSFLDSAELLHAASAELAARRHVPSPPRAAMWQALLRYLATTPSEGRSIEGLLQSLIGRAAEDSETLRQAAIASARAAGRQNILAALARARFGKARSGVVSELRRSDLPAASRPMRPIRGRTAFSLSDSEDGAFDEVIYVDNAGLVLTGPFLPLLFERLQLVAADEGGKSRIRDYEAASRAVHLLQYLVDGRCAAPEPLLVLNKIMSGVPIAAPILPAIVPTEAERELCDSLLKAMIAHWEIIKDSSVEALRETFLQRAGRLTRRGEEFTLKVERKTVDVLVDRVPWSFAVIFNAWMPHPLHVTW